MIIGYTSMKEKKFTEPSTLGACIRMERKKAGLTQAQLGKLIGLGESRVSKIENGTPSVEVASYILGKLGSELKLKVVSVHNDKKSVSFLMSVINYFSKNKGISLSAAYRYLKRFKGLEYLNNYMEVERTLSFDDIAENLSTVCANNGGSL